MNFLIAASPVPPPARLLTWRKNRACGSPDVGRRASGLLLGNWVEHPRRAGRRPIQTNVRDGSDSDLTAPMSDFRFTPQSRLKSDIAGGPFRATSRLMHRNHDQLYSITSSARPSNDWGTVRPSILAVLRLMTISTFVACWTGRSAGFSPFRIRPV